jgi:hypothetical protein
MDFNDGYDEVSFLEIYFLLSEAFSKKTIKVHMKFNDIYSFDIKQIGGNYNQISGFEIIDQKESGWEMSHRYVIRDFENDRINFYCSSIEVINVEEVSL